MVKLLSVISNNTMLNLLDSIVEVAGSIVGAIMWLFSIIFFWLLDIFESLFRKFAGIDNEVTNAAGEAIEGDLVLYMVQSDLIQQIFMSILILSLFLLIIFTILAIVKNQYSEKQEPVSKIVNNSVKALLMYLLVPIATIVCLLVGNVVLQAIDGATKNNDYAQSMADNLFTAATYNANRLRSGSVSDKASELEKLLENGYIPVHVQQEIEQHCNVDLSDTDSFAMIYVATGESVVDYDTMATIIDEAFITGNLQVAGGNESSKWDWTTVDNFYKPFQISYPIIWIGGCFLIWSIGKITWGLVARLFKMTLYFAISPAVMATFPIDNGKALGSWRGEMVKNGTMAFCAVGVLNVLYSILPFFNDIKLFSSGFLSGVANAIVKIFLYIIAFSSAKDLIGAISGWFGTGDALAEGVKAKGAVKGAYKNTTKMLADKNKKALGYFAGIRGGIDVAEKQGKNKFWGAVQGAYSQTGAAKVRSEFAKASQDAKKAGEAQYKHSKTTGFFTGLEKEKKLEEYEGREAVAKEKKKLQDQLDEVKEQFNKTVENMTKGSTEYQKAEKARDKELDKIMSGASFLDPLFAKDQRSLDKQKKKLEKRQSNFASFDNLEKGYEQDTRFKELVSNSSGWTGMTDEIWQEVKQGDYRNVAGGYKAKVQKAYEMYAADVASNEHGIQRAKQSITNLVNSGDDGLEYAKTVLGTKFSNMFDEITNAAGEIEYQLKNTTLSDGDISALIKKEQEGVTEAVRKLDKATKDMFAERAKKYDNLDVKDFRDIGKDGGKK